MQTNSKRIIAKNKSALFDAIQLEIEEKYPIIDFVVSHSNLLEDSKTMVSKIFPEWPLEQLNWTQCKDGITNKCKGVTNYSNEM